MFASIAPNIEVLAETTNMDTVVLSTTEILSVSLDVVEDEIKNANFEEAKQLTKENSEFFSLQVLTLRESNSEITDEIHILLLDMHNEIEAGNESLVSDNIALLNFKAVTDDAHARFDASSRSYEYHIHFQKNPFISGRSFLFPYKSYDRKKMKEGFKKILRGELSREDFADIIGAATESTIRLISEFKKKGFIAIKGKRITILDESELEKVAKGF